MSDLPQSEHEGCTECHTETPVCPEVDLETEWGDTTVGVVVLFAFAMGYMLG